MEIIIVMIDLIKGWLRYFIGCLNLVWVWNNNLGY